MNRLLEDDVLRLRACEPADVQLVYDVENDTAEWETSANVAPVPAHVISRYLQEMTGDFFIDGQLKLVIERKSDGAAVGIFDIYNYDHLSSRAEVGMIVFAPFRGMGYGRRAALAVMEYAFGRLRLNQLYAYFTVDNEASISLYTSLGFEVAGRLRQWFYTGGGYKDAVIMQLCR